MYNQYTTMVHDFGLRGYHIMSGVLRQPETDLILRDNNDETPPKNSLDTSASSIDSLPYYHRDIKSSDEAIKFIKSKPPKVGQFIVRNSSKGKEFLSITVELIDRNIKHINIKMDRDSSGRTTFCLLKEMGKFSSLDSLIEFYRVNPIENIEKVKDVRLLYPIKRVEGVATAAAAAAVAQQQQQQRRRTAELHSNLLDAFSAAYGNGPGAGFGPTPSPTPTPSSPTTPPSPSSPTTSPSPSASSPVERRRRHAASVAASDFSGTGSGTGTLGSGMGSGTGTGSGTGFGSSGFGYTYARDLNVDQSHALKMSLEMSEQCKCGINKLESRLPGNYTIHKAEYPDYGWKLYFQDGENQTAWTLPDHIVRRLEPYHWKNLTKLYAPNQLPPWLLKRRPVFAHLDEV